MWKARVLQSLKGEPELTAGVHRPNGAFGTQIAQSRSQRGGCPRIRFMTDEGPVEIRAQQTNGHRLLVVESPRAEPMKSAYELAMERLAAKEPAVRLSDDQKTRIAAVESKCKADIAAKELLLRGEMDKASTARDLDQVAQLQRQLSDEIRRLEEKRDREKASIRGEAETR
jgi:hypothetical protein